MATSDNKYSLYQEYEKINGEWKATSKYKAYLISVDDEDCSGTFSSVTRYEDVCEFGDKTTYKITDKYKSEDGGATWTLINTSTVVESVVKDSVECGYSDNITTSSETVCVQSLCYDGVGDFLFGEIEIKLYFDDNTLKTLRKEKGEMYFKIISSVPDSSSNAYYPKIKITKYYFNGTEIESRRTYEQVGYSYDCGSERFKLELKDTICNGGIMNYLYKVQNYGTTLSIYVIEPTSTVCDDCSFMYNGQVYNTDKIETFSLPSLGIENNVIIPDCISTILGDTDTRCNPPKALNAFVSSLIPENMYYNACVMNYCIADGNNVYLSNHNYNLNEWSFMSYNDSRRTSVVHFEGTISEAYSKLKNAKIMTLICSDGIIYYYGWDDEYILYFNNKKSQSDYNIVVELYDGRIMLFKSTNGFVDASSLQTPQSIKAIKLENGIKNFTNIYNEFIIKYNLPSTLETLSGVTFKETDDITYNGTVEKFRDLMVDYKNDYTPWWYVFTVKCTNGVFKCPDSLIVNVEIDKPDDEETTYKNVKKYLKLSSGRKLMEEGILNVFEIPNGTTKIHKEEYPKLYDYAFLKIPSSVSTIYLGAFSNSQKKSGSGVYTNYDGISEIWFEGSLSRWRKLFISDYKYYFPLIKCIIVYCNDGCELMCNDE